MLEDHQNPFAAPQGPVNQLPPQVDYRIQETAYGTWRSFMYENGSTYQEFTSHARLGDLPFLHYTTGKSPETGRSTTAHGVIAIGRFAKGLIAIGQVASGFITVGQASFGVISFGQLAIGVTAVGQAAVAGLAALGQFAASGYVAVGQLAAGVVAHGVWAYPFPPWW